MLKFTPDNQAKPKRGSLLLAEPFLDDPYFKRTVIVLCEHNEEGSFGFVLNNYVEVSLESMVEEMPAFETRVSIGGPVKNSNLYYIHTLGNQLEDSLPITDKLFMGGDFHQLRDLMTSGQLKENQIRFFVGYSGWAENQLQEELDAKSWFVAEGFTNELMNTHNDDLWADIVTSLGKEYEHLANYPQDPNLN